MADPIDLEAFKQAARLLAKSTGIKSSHAHEVLARQEGFRTYAALRQAWKEQQPEAANG